jgi:uncharacterized membrane protein YfcA
MTVVVRTVLEGYRLLFRRVFQALLFLAILALVSGVVAAPVWLLASTAPRLLNWLFVLLCSVLIVLTVRERRRNRPTRRAAEPAVLARILPVIVAVAAAGIIAVGIAGRSTLLLLTGVVFFSVDVAWVLGR